MTRTRFWRAAAVALALPCTAAWLAAVAALPPRPRQKPGTTPAARFAAATADDFIDDAICAACHPQQAATFGRSGHRSYSSDPKKPVDKRGCQSCHGPGKAHLEAGDDTAKKKAAIVQFTASSARDQAEACLRCHGDVMSAAQWKRMGHARADVGCAACHRIHAPEAGAGPAGADEMKGATLPGFVAVKETRHLLRAAEPVLCDNCHKREVSEFRRTFHHPVPEGRMVCSDCHDPHPGPATHRRVSPGKDACVTCHPETAGPFVYEHDPVAGWTGSGCVECHRPHGSHNPALLNTFSRGACNQCHTDLGNSHYPGHTCWYSGCHVAVHGSNRDRTLLRR